MKYLLITSLGDSSTATLTPKGIHRPSTATCSPSERAPPSPPLPPSLRTGLQPILPCSWDYRHAPPPLTIVVTSQNPPHHLGLLYSHCLIHATHLQSLLICYVFLSVSPLPQVLQGRGFCCLRRFCSCGFPTSVSPVSRTEPSTQEVLNKYFPNK
jgi:hypothetical protein